MWDASLYLRFGGERARPFFDLLARVGAELPEYVVDLGCGPGNLTALLAERWPSAAVCGVDSSPQMIEAARKLLPAAAQRAAGSGPVLTSHAPGLSFVLDDIRHWEPQSLPDVIVSNAVLQWVPGHRELLVRWADWLADGGWLAFQVPGNFDQPAHAILRELVVSARWRPLLADVELNRQSADPADYAELLAGAGCEADAWETTYVHILQGDNPVLEWYKGTGLRPVLDALDADQAAGFLAEYGERVRAAYPPSSFGTFLPFRRVFTVARKILLSSFPIELIGKLWQDHGMRRGLPLPSVPRRQCVPVGRCPLVCRVQRCPIRPL
ncbi:MAG TPA: trans-aconitate 2-methyltransferase [Streptosporangiaceae bacterium]|nr:trans-aconitate 2-methyltransferase [Streptosporangiaceae bacterium]